MEDKEHLDFLENVRKALVDLNKSYIETSKIIDDNFESIDKRLVVIEESVKNLNDNSQNSFNTVGKKIDELKQEVHKIQKVSNYTEEYENLMKIVR